MIAYFSELPKFPSLKCTMIGEPTEWVETY